MERLGDDPRDVVGIGHEVVVLGDRHRDAADVGLLEGVGADGGRADLTGDRDDRHRVHVGVGERGDEVRRAGAGGRHADADPAGRRGVALGGVAGALLVAHEDVPHLDRVEERVVGRQDRAAGDAEDGVDVHRLEREHEALRAGHLDRACGPWPAAPPARGSGRWGPLGQPGSPASLRSLPSPFSGVNRCRGRRPCTKKPSSPVAGRRRERVWSVLGQTRRESTRTRATRELSPCPYAVSTGETADPTIRNREVAHPGRAGALRLTAPLASRRALVVDGPPRTRSSA